jgi:hypothetical protein
MGGGFAEAEPRAWESGGTRAGTCCPSRRSRGNGNGAGSNQGDTNCRGCHPGETQELDVGGGDVEGI